MCYARSRIRKAPSNTHAIAPKIETTNVAFRGAIKYRNVAVKTKKQTMISDDANIHDVWYIAEKGPAATAEKNSIAA